MIAIASLSTRFLSEVASQSHQKVFSMDVFGDLETLKHSEKWLSIGPSSPFPSIDEDRFLDALERTKRSGCTFWVAGSGFEKNFRLLKLADDILPRLGVSSLVFEKIRNPKVFFSTLDVFEIPYPKVSFSAKTPHDFQQNWLKKSLCCCGGLGVRKSVENLDERSSFFQQEIDGLHLSASFIGNGQDIIFLGVCKLLNRRIDNFPYIYSGILGPVNLSNLILKRLEGYALCLSKAFHLKGYFGLDFILKENMLYILELNPRLTSSLEVFEKKYDGLLFNCHCDIFLQGDQFDLLCLEELKKITKVDDKCFGISIIFAPKNMEITELEIKLLREISYTTDCPASGRLIEKNQPLCSVFSEGHNLLYLQESLETMEREIMQLFCK